MRRQFVLQRFESAPDGSEYYEYLLTSSQSCYTDATASAGLITSTDASAAGSSATDPQDSAAMLTSALEALGVVRPAKSGYRPS